MGRKWFGTKVSFLLHNNLHVAQNSKATFQTLFFQTFHVVKQSSRYTCAPPASKAPLPRPELCHTGRARVTSVLKDIKSERYAAAACGATCRWYVHPRSMTLRNSITAHTSHHAPFERRRGHLDAPLRVSSFLFPWRPRTPRADPADAAPPRLRFRY